MLPLGQRGVVPKDKQIVGGYYRENAVCPFCYSFDRERLVLLFLHAKTDVFTAKLKLLHVAPEPHLMKVLKNLPNLDYLSGDIESPRAMTKMDITKIDRNDKTFDAIICNHVLEHIPDDRKAMAELYRILKPGGWAILQVPLSPLLEQTYEPPIPDNPRLRKKEFGQEDHVRIYGKDYKDRLKQAGFQVDAYNYSKEFGEETAKKYALIAEESLFFCTRAD